MTYNNATDSRVTQYNVIVGDAKNRLANVAPSSTSGVPLISQGSSSNPIFGEATVPGGGTGAGSFVSYSPIVGGTVSTGALQSVASAGTSGQPLLSAGASTLPAYGNLLVPAGGTGGSSFVAYSPVVGGVSTTGALQSVASVGTSGQVLTSNGAAALPTFQSLPSSGGGTLLVSAYLSSTIQNVTGDGTYYQIVFDTAPVNVGSNYNTSTGVFTVPITGNYMLSCAILLQNPTAPISGLTFNGTVIVGLTSPTNSVAGSGNISSNLQWSGPLSASSTVIFYAYGTLPGSKTTWINGGTGPYVTFFSIVALN